MDNALGWPKIQPDMIRRTGGGWLAVARKGALLTIGVTAPTEDEAYQKFCSVYKRWIEILEQK